MPSLIVTLRDLLLLRRGPQDLPYSPVLLVVAAMVNLVLSQFSMMLQLPQGQDHFLSAVVGTVLRLGLLYLVLNALQRQARFMQTATAILLLDVIVNAASLPLLQALQPVLAASSMPGATPETVAGAMSGVTLLATLLLVVLVVWYVVVNAHILRQALEIRLFGAFLVYLSIAFAGTVMLGVLFGAAPES